MTIFFLAIHGNQHLIAIFSLTISGASLGFLFWNRNPASIYLGDCGSLFIGLILSVLLLQFEPTNNSLISSIAIPILVLAVPIIDTTVVVTSRLIRGVSIFKSGRDHLSHRLIASGISRKGSALILWSMSSTFSIFSLLSDFTKLYENFLPISGLLLMLAIILWFLRRRHL
jgi:UDP-GlcNAc:undecaprenyl-phosphate GlcNAc-1-phosphate transferase